MSSYELKEFIRLFRVAFKFSKSLELVLLFCIIVGVVLVRGIWGKRGIIFIFLGDCLRSFRI